MSTPGALRLASIAQIHELIGRPPPAPPLLSIIAASWQEPLHRTDAEGEAFTGLVRQIDLESSVPPDPFAPVVLTAQLQLLLTYCHRAYARQIEVRAKAGGVVAERLDRHLDEHLVSAAQPGRGLPTVRSCARALGYSPDGAVKGTSCTRKGDRSQR